MKKKDFKLSTLQVEGAARLQSVRNVERGRLGAGSDITSPASGAWD